MKCQISRGRPLGYVARPKPSGWGPPDFVPRLPLQGCPLCTPVRHAGLRKAVEVTPLYSLRENAITKEPGPSYPERWRCASRLGASMVA